MSNNNILSKTIGVIVIVLILSLGHVLLYTVVGITACGWVARKILKDEIKPMLPAISIQSYQFLWTLLGLFVFGLSINTIIEPVLLGSLLVWLIKWTGIAPVAILVVYQVVAFIVKFPVFLNFDFGNVPYKVAVVSLLLRVGAVTYMVTGLVKFKIQMRTRISNMS